MIFFFIRIAEPGCISSLARKKVTRAMRGKIFILATLMVTLALIHVFTHSLIANDVKSLLGFFIYIQRHKVSPSSWISLACKGQWKEVILLFPLCTYGPEWTQFISSCNSSNKGIKKLKVRKQHSMKQHVGTWEHLNPKAVFNVELDYWFNSTHTPLLKETRLSCQVFEAIELVPLVCCSLALTRVLKHKDTFVAHLLFLTS